ncbi:MAG: phytanoyl-CoA dioxygenase family protein, partial [Actinomycetota bacterium]
RSSRREGNSKVLREAKRIGLTDEQRERFERDGYLVVDDALDAAHVSRLTDAVDRVWAAHRDPPIVGADPLHLLAFVGRDPLFLELLDHEPILRLVVDLLGWNVFMHHCHLDVHPPMRGPSPRRWMWHQDGGVQNHDLDTHPRPRMSVKVAYFLSDVSQPGRGNFSVLPCSHLRNTIERPADDDNAMNGAVPILARPGTAVLFDRRLWHMRGENRSSLTRKALFYAYTYRWVRARDDIRIPPELFATITPVRAQLLGAGSSAIGHWMPSDDDAALRAWWETASR